jgi:hypothetical protein
MSDALFLEASRLTGAPGLGGNRAAQRSILVRLHYLGQVESAHDWYGTIASLASPGSVLEAGSIFKEKIKCRS